MAKVSAKDTDAFKQRETQQDGALIFNATSHKHRKEKSVGMKKPNVINMPPAVEDWNQFSQSTTGKGKTELHLAAYGGNNPLQTKSSR